MKYLIAVAMLCLPLFGASLAHSKDFFDNKQERFGCSERLFVKLETVIRAYETALNASDVDGVMSLYTKDAVVLAPQAQSAVGFDEVTDSYTGTFEAIDLDISFEIAEVKLLSPRWAMVRTNSTGVINLLAQGIQIPEGNQELFLLEKVGREWKIARYSFSSFLAQ